MIIKLEVSRREESAKAVKLKGYIPGIVYGPKQEPISISVNKMILTKTLQNVGESTIITLIGLDEDIEVLVHKVDFNAEKGGVEHIDFYAIERGKNLTTNVSFEFVGEAPIEKTGATVTKVLQEIEITCRPSALPSHIDVDISMLTEESSQILVKDLDIDDDIIVSIDGSSVVAAVSAAREEEPEDVVDIDMSSVDVEEKGKVETEDEEEPTK